MINNIAKNIWQLEFTRFGSCVYVLNLDDKTILIDTSTKQNREELLKDLKKIGLKKEQVKIIILTHNHYDHVENNSIFPNAKIYRSQKEFDKSAQDIKTLKINSLEIIETPGHSKEGICIYYPKEKILFSGDTIFHNGIIGRIDLPGSSLKEMKDSLNKLRKIDYKILCPGHI